MAMTTGSVGPLMVGAVKGKKKAVAAPKVAKSRPIPPVVPTALDNKTAKEHHRQRLGAPPPFPAGNGKAATMARRYGKAI